MSIDADFRAQPSKGCFFARHARAARCTPAGMRQPSSAGGLGELRVDRGHMAAGKGEQQVCGAGTYLRPSPAVRPLDVVGDPAMLSQTRSCADFWEANDALERATEGVLGHQRRPVQWATDVLVVDDVLGELRAGSHSVEQPVRLGRQLHTEAVQ
jgi:hypothetical protein